MTPTTLFDKIWSAHEIAPGLIFIDQNGLGHTPF